MPTPILSDEQEREVIALYSDPTMRLLDIKQTYGIGDSVIYRILKRNGIVPNRNPGGGVKRIAQPVEALAALPPHNALSVTTDGQGYVERTERVRTAAKMYTWKVRFESAMRVDATDIQDAIEQVQRMPMCRRVFNVALKGAL